MTIILSVASGALFFWLTGFATGKVWGFFSNMTKRATRSQ